MNDLERAIRETLSERDAELFETLGADQVLHRQVVETFKGRQEWINTLGWAADFALFAVGCVFA